MLIEVDSGDEKEVDVFSNKNNMVNTRIGNIRSDVSILDFAMKYTTNMKPSSSNTTRI
jgi:hypothetical protein